MEANMFREAFIFNIPTTVLASGNGTVFTEIPVRTPQFDFEVRRTIHTSTDNRIYKKIYDGFMGRYLFNSAIDLRSISGVSLSGITSYGFIPYNWPIPYTLKQLTSLSVYLSDFSVAQNTIDLTYHGVAIYPNAPIDIAGKPVNLEEKRAVAPITYSSDVISVTAGVGGLGNGQMTFLPDSDFVCTKLTGILGGTTPDVYVEIHDAGRMIDWQQGKTRIGNLIGNGQFPHILTAPRFVMANSNLNIKVTNNTGNAATLQLFAHGYKRGAR
jgi:hypothetical protein